MNGFLNLSKSAGFTSHDCVAKVRRLVRQKRVGHAGTLDPAATGVLPIALGKATRLLQFLQSDKAYQATVRLGVQTTTDDLEGDMLHVEPVPDLTLETVTSALQNFVGTIAQIPPAYSAIQVQGQRLYDLARTGQAVAVPLRFVQVYDLSILGWRGGDFPEIDLAIACGPGTYIRAIARDLGQAVGTVGTLATLIRTSSSGFQLADSLTLEQLEAQLEQNCFQPMPPERVLAHLSALVLPEAIARRWCQGQRIALEEKPEMLVESDPDTLRQPPLRVHDENDCFLGIGCISKGETGLILSPQVVFESS